MSDKKISSSLKDVKIDEEKFSESESGHSRRLATLQSEATARIESEDSKPKNSANRRAKKATKKEKKNKKEEKGHDDDGDGEDSKCFKVMQFFQTVKQRCVGRDEIYQEFLRIFGDYFNSEVFGIPGSLTKEEIFERLKILFNYDPELLEMLKEIKRLSASGN